MTAAIRMEQRAANLILPLLRWYRTSNAGDSLIAVATASAIADPVLRPRPKRYRWATERATTTALTWPISKVSSANLIKTATAKTQTNQGRADSDCVRPAYSIGRAVSPVTSFADIAAAAASDAALTRNHTYATTGSGSNASGARACASSGG